jgi:hypothetical protein
MDKVQKPSNFECYIAMFIGRKESIYFPLDSLKVIDLTCNSYTTSNFQEEMFFKYFTASMAAAVIVVRSNDIKLCNFL